MNNDELIKKWLPLLQYKSETCVAIPESDYVLCAKVLEQAEQQAKETKCKMYLKVIIPIIRQNYKNMTDVEFIYDGTAAAKNLITELNNKCTKE